MTRTRTDAAVGTPYELDIRRQLNQARQDLAAAYAELAVRRDQETLLRAHLERLAADARATDHRYAELHVAHLELLTHARATAASAAIEELAPARYVIGHLEEIGLQPLPGAVPDHIVAQGLALAIDLEGKR